MTVVPGADHNLGSPQAQMLLARTLDELLRAVRRVPAAQPDGADSHVSKPVLAAPGWR